MRIRGAGIVVVLLAGACSGAGGDVALSRAPSPSVAPAPAVTTAVVTDDSEVVPVTTPPGDVEIVEVPTTAAPPPAPAPPTTEAAIAASPVPSSAPFVAAVTANSRARAWTIAPYQGFGAWLDAYDWSAQFSRSGDVAGPEAIDHMAAEGVQTLYIQTSRWNSPTDVLEPERLRAIIDRAHSHGIAVISWYLPTLEDLATDLRRILAVADFGVDGIAIDIEARNVGDVAERNRRLVQLSGELRAALPDKAIGAIVLEPVLIEDVNPRYWPDFPWTEIAPFYDVWLPMSYWTNRRGQWRAAYDYTATNMARIRERIGQPEAPIHTIGGIGDKTTVSDLDQMVAAAVDQRAIGGSIYDYRTSRQEFWSVLRSFRTGS